MSKKPKNQATGRHKFLTVKEVAEYLRIPLPTMYYLLKRGRIPAFQVGGRWRIKASDVDAIVEGGNSK
jgi:excisionase family DNA binding protein